MKRFPLSDSGNTLWTLALALALSLSSVKLGVKNLLHWGRIFPLFFEDGVRASPLNICFNIRHPYWYVHAKVYLTLINSTVTTNTHTCNT